MREGDHLKDPGGGETIISQRFLAEWDGPETGSIWLRIRKSGGVF
jgi:hypothetical protein